MAQPRGGAALRALPGWKTAASAIAAFVIAILFIVAGVWKITDPFGAAARLAEAQVPGPLSLPAAILLGVGETWVGVLILVPRFRRWGAWLSGLLLVAFMIYIGIYYDVLRGEECNCFPWVKRAVGPAFFIGDAIMLVMAAVAGWWARPSSSQRSAALVLVAVSVFAGVSYGIGATRLLSGDVPPAIAADGKPVSLHDGRIFLYFFNPECSSCLEAARNMAAWEWNDVKIIAVVTELPQFAEGFMKDSGLQAPVSTDAGALRESISFTTTPYAVALENGRQLAAFPYFDGQQPEQSLRRLGFID